MPSFFERLRERYSVRRSNLVADPIDFSLRKVRIATIVSWVAVLPLFLASMGGDGSWPLAGHIASALVALLASTSAFLHSRHLGLVGRGSPLRYESIFMVVFAVLFAIFAIVSGSNGMHASRLMNEIRTTDPSQVVCLARFTTPASAGAPMLNAQFAAMVEDMDAKMAMANMDWMGMADSPLQIKMNAAPSVGCSLASGDSIPKTQLDGLGIELSGSLGERIQRMLSFIPVPFYPLRRTNVAADPVYVCSPGVYDFAVGLTDYAEANPFPVCIDSRVPAVIGAGMSAFSTNMVACVLLVVYLGLLTAIASKSRYFAKGIALAMSLPAPVTMLQEVNTAFEPPSYFVGENAPLIKGDVKM